jgi:hypothetical protein
MQIHLRVSVMVGECSFVKRRLNMSVVSTYALVEHYLIVLSRIVNKYCYGVGGRPGKWDSIPGRCKRFVFCPQRGLLLLASIHHFVQHVEEAILLWR